MSCTILFYYFFLSRVIGTLTETVVATFFTQCRCHGSFAKFLLCFERKGEVEGLRRHAEVHGVNENEASEKYILSWVRSDRIFKNRAKKSKNPDARNMLIEKEN